MKIITNLLLILVVQLLTVSGSALAESACKGLSKSSCSVKSTCSWVKGFTNKNGNKVSAHCRTKPGKGSAKSKSKKSTRKASRKSEDSAAKKKEVKKKKKKDKAKSETKKKDSKKKKDKKKKKKDKKKKKNKKKSS